MRILAGICILVALGCCATAQTAAPVNVPEPILPVQQTIPLGQTIRVEVDVVNVLCTVETRNHQHLAELRARLKEHGVETFDSK